MRMFPISRANREILHQHAGEEYPDECCGVIMGKKGGTPASDQVRKLANIQNRLHRQDPKTHPRDASIAYHIDPEEFYKVLKEAGAEDLEIKAIYHSHPENPVYFSDEDREKALIWGEPPCDYYLIMSIYGRAVKEEAVFHWKPSERTFLREEIKEA